MTMADRPMGVPIDDAVCFREDIPQRLFDVWALVGAMGKTDGEAAKLKEVLFGKTGANGDIAHVAANCMNGFAGKGIDDGHPSEVTGMDDNIAGMKTGADLLQKASVRVRRWASARTPA